MSDSHSALWPFYSDDDANVRAVRRGLRDVPFRYDLVHMKCFNRDEAAYIWRALTPTERTCVRLTWLFGSSESLSYE
jgi:hypothetical protein